MEEKPVVIKDLVRSHNLESLQSLIKKGIDIHHITDRENRIENLMLLTREMHIEHGEIKKSMVMLLEEHRLFLDFNGVLFDNDWFEEKIKRYS